MTSVLYVDDETTLLEIGKIYLEQSGEFSVTVFDSAREALSSLEREEYDAIISDYQMPDIDGIEFLKQIRKRFGTVPFILFTGRGREEIVIEAINSGADFYLQKGGGPQAQFAELMHKMRIAVEKRRSEQALLESERKYRSVIENMQDLFFQCNAEGILTMASPSWAVLLGYDSVDDCLGRPVADTFWYHPEQFQDFLAAIHSEGTIENFEILLKHKSGTPVVVSAGSYLTQNPDQEMSGIEGIFRDITDQKKAELRQKEDHRLIESILQGLPFPTFVIDNSCRVILWNRALEEYSGIRAEEIIGTAEAHKAFYRSARPCLADLVVRNNFQEIDSLYSAGVTPSPLIQGAFEATEFFPHLNGGAWITITASPLCDIQGRVIGAVEILQDITRKRKNDEDLADAYRKMETAFNEARISQNLLEEQNWFLNQYESKYRDMVRVSANLHWETDTGGVFIGISEQCEDLLGYTCDDLIRTSLFDLAPLPVRPVIRESLAAHDWVADPVLVFEMPVISRKHRVVSCEIRAVPARDPGGAIRGYRGIARRIDDQGSLEAGLRQEHRNFLKIFSAARDSLLLVNEKQEILRANDAFLLFAGKDLQDLIGKNLGPGIGCVHCRDDVPGCGLSHECLVCDLNQGIASVLRPGGSTLNEHHLLTITRGNTLAETRVWVRVESLELQGKPAALLSLREYGEFLEERISARHHRTAHGSAAFLAREVNSENREPRK